MRKWEELTLGIAASKLDRDEGSKRLGNFLPRK
jgi:hypothetical protein